MKYLFVLTIPFLISCGNQDTDWNGLAIHDFKSYTLPNNFKLFCFHDRYELKYILVDEIGELLIQTNERISIVHKWGIFVDKNYSVWVFSSDIGHSVWRRDINGEYRFEVFDRALFKTDVPPELNNSSLGYFIK